MRSVEITAVLILLVLFLFGVKMNQEETIRLKDHIADQARMRNLEPDFIYKMINTESSWRRRAESIIKNCRGLMQVSPAALSDYNTCNRTYYKADDLFNPYINTKIGIWYLAWIRDNFTGENKRDILICYCNGVGWYKTWAKAGSNLGDLSPGMEIYLKSILDER